jgi:hypothetical protein
MLLIPLGVDCQITFLLRDNLLRTASWPFDWTVTYNGVSDIIKNKFQGYLPTTPTVNENAKVSCHTYFMHNTFPEDSEHMNRRIDRFLDLLNGGDQELVFIRRGHSHHHHKEANDFGVCIKDDLQDMEELYDHLQNTYPYLKFRILLILVCGECFDPVKNYMDKNVRKNLHIYNIAHLGRDDERFKQFFMETILGKVF